MYILLQKGMKIKAGDEFCRFSEWFPVEEDAFGLVYTACLFPYRRKITTIKELVEALGENNETI